MRFELLLELLSVAIHGYIPTTGGNALRINGAQGLPIRNMDMTPVTEPHSKSCLHLHEL